jgi:hypothetical protein
MFLKLLPPWAWISLVLANCLMGVASTLTGNYELTMLNILSASCCFIAYISSKKT